MAPLVFVWSSFIGFLGSCQDRSSLNPSSSICWSWPGIDQVSPYYPATEGTLWTVQCKQPIYSLDCYVSGVPLQVGNKGCKTFFCVALGNNNYLYFLGGAFSPTHFLFCNPDSFLFLRHIALIVSIFRYF